ncbi:hypothetical protein CBL_09235 [Carabus blaptoides fortunei]
MSDYTVSCAARCERVYACLPVVKENLKPAQDPDKNDEWTVNKTSLLCLADVLLSVKPCIGEIYGLLVTDIQAVPPTIVASETLTLVRLTPLSDTLRVMTYSQCLIRIKARRDYS